MATVNNPEDQEQNQQSGSPVTVSGTGGASASGGQGAGGAAAPATVSPVQQNQAPQNNQGYVDVESYLSANQGGSQDLGNRVATNLTNDYNTTKQNVDKSAQSVQDLANQGYTQENAGLIQEAAANPTQTAADQNKVSAVQAQLNDKYTGPSNWTDFGTQQGNVATAQQEGALTTTPGGLNVLAQTVEGQTGRNQSQGINQLDSLLLGGSPQAMQTIQTAADPYKGLTDYLNSKNTAVTGTISNAQNAATTAANNAKAALLGDTGATGKLTSELNAQLAQKQAAAQSQLDEIKAALGKENPTAQDLATLGISADQWNALQNQLNMAQNAQSVSSANGQWGAKSGTTDIDLTQFLTQQSPAAQLTLQNTATPEQVARAQALQTLVGANNFTSPLTDASVAGTAPTNLNSFNYKDALAYTQGIANAERDAAQAYVNAKQQGMDDAHAQQLAQDKAKGDLGAVMGGVTAPLALLNNVGIGGDLGNAINHITQNIGKPIANAVNTITNIFCFHPATLVTMEDGSEKPISQIEIKDKTKGGEVWAVKKAVGTDFYWYRGVLVTGKHAVKENGKWIRVETSSDARRVPNFVEVVFNLVTSDHRIWANGIEFADELETDQYESLNLDESLIALNSQIHE